MEANSSSNLVGSGRATDNFSFYCEGDVDPTLNKKIHTLIDSDDSYIVYLDAEFFVEYSWTANYGKAADGFAEVANTVAHLESLSIIYLAGDQKVLFGRMLGEAMARIVGDRDGERAKEALGTAISFLNARSLERARLWYLKASALTTIICIICGVTLWVFRDSLIAIAGSNVFDISLGGMAGAIGSFLSIWIQPDRIKMDAGALKLVHLWEGAARIVIGVACALTMALAIKSGIVLSVTKYTEHPLLYLLVICIAVGFSERAFLNLIEHFNDPTLHKNKQKRK
jgi:hypothetical protein